MAKIWLSSKKQNLAAMKREAYVTRSVTLPRIDKDELLNRAAANSGIRRGVVYSAADAILNEFENFLLNGHSVELPLIGSFRFGVNAHASEEEIDAGASKVYRRKMLFVPNVALKRKLEVIELVDMNMTIGNGGEENPEPPEP